MVGILVEVALSWLILWVLAKKHLTVLGIIPTKTRLIHLLIGFLLAVFCCFLYFSVKTYFEKSEWIINKNFTAMAALKSSWWVVISVLFEELIFRGALLYLAIKIMGVTKACLLSAICFGIYHWFSYGAFGNPVQMFFIFLMTGLWGYMFAMAFAKTKTLYLPVGLHFGWNLVQTVVFSQGPLGDQLIFKYTGEPISGMQSLLAFAVQLFTLPLLCLWYLRRYGKLNNPN
jgi:uncharacterized protein